MQADIDAYYSLDPLSYSELVEAGITPADKPASQGLTFRLVLAARVDSGRHLALFFTGVTGLTVEDFSGPSVSPFEIVATGDRGWESPRYLVSSDQGRVKFGCMEFRAKLVAAPSSE
jgi:hypothetical protein